MVKAYGKEKLGSGVGKEGLEPSRIAARDPKSRLSANSSTSPANQQGNYKLGDFGRQYGYGRRRKVGYNLPPMIKNKSHDNQNQEPM